MSSPISKQLQDPVENMRRENLVIIEAPSLIIPEKKLPPVKPSSNPLTSTQMQEPKLQPDLNVP